MVSRATSAIHGLCSPLPHRASAEPPLTPSSACDDAAQALQDLVPGVTLPWWDWTSSEGIPEAFAEEVDVNDEPNPLQAPVVAAGGFRGDGWPERTFRNPGVEGGPLPSAEWIDWVLAAANYDDFALRVEQLHNQPHVWVGGTMGNQRFAGWDPLFWAHQTMIDRLWAIWQLAHPGDNPRRRHLDKGLNYFKDMTVADTLGFEDLGYEYAVSEVLVHTGG